MIWEMKGDSDSESWIIRGLKVGVVFVSGVVVVSGRGIWNEDRGRRWVGFEVDWTGVLKGVGLETEGVTGIWGRGGRVSVNERVDTGESVIRKVLFEESGGADGEGELESRLRVFVDKSVDLNIRDYSQSPIIERLI